MPKNIVICAAGTGNSTVAARFTVRTLGGLITTCGIFDLKRYDTNTAVARGLDEAYRAYRRKYQTWLWRMLIVSGILVVTLVGSFWLQFHVANRLDRRYSAFWHHRRLPLRKALGF